MRGAIGYVAAISLAASPVSGCAAAAARSSVALAHDINRSPRAAYDAAAFLQAVAATIPMLEVAADDHNVEAALILTEAVALLGYVDKEMGRVGRGHARLERAERLARSMIGERCAVWKRFIPVVDKSTTDCRLEQLSREATAMLSRCFGSPDPDEDHYRLLVAWANASLQLQTRGRNMCTTQAVVSGLLEYLSTTEASDCPPSSACAFDRGLPLLLRAILWRWRVRAGYPPPPTPVEQLEAEARDVLGRRSWVDFVEARSLDLHVEPERAKALREAMATEPLPRTPLESLLEAIAYSRFVEWSGHIDDGWQLTEDTLESPTKAGRD
jgi:hypothetical protein